MFQQVNKAAAAAERLPLLSSKGVSMTTILLVTLIVLCVVLLYVVANLSGDISAVLSTLLIALAMALIAGAATLLLRS